MTQIYKNKSNSSQISAYYFLGAVYTGKGTIPVQRLLIYYIYLDIAIDKNPEKKQKSCVSHFRLMFQCLIKAMLEKVIC